MMSCLSGVGSGRAGVLLSLWLLLSGLAWGDEASNAVRMDPAFRNLLSAIVRRCPKQYPEKVKPLPEAGEWDEVPVKALIALLGHWSPSIRAAVGAELGRRGDAAVPALKASLKADAWRVRAGAAVSLRNIVQQKIKHGKTHGPAARNWQEAATVIKGEYEAFIPLLLPLLKDEQRDVRRAALDALVQVQSGQTEVSTGLLRLFRDRDAYLAQHAMIQLEKRVGVEGVNAELLMASIRAAMQTPLPRGKEHVMRIVARLPEAEQRELMPVLLDHLDWYPDRDTMFAAGGQVRALKILTRLKAKRLIPKLPKLLEKRLRGLDMFDEALKSIEAFGPAAKPILPGIKAYGEHLEQQLMDLEGQNHRRANRTRKALKAKLEKLRKGMANVSKQ